MARMRTAAKVMELIREEDPDTEVTLYYIRGLIRTGRIPVTNVGRKKLVDADAVIAYIAAGSPPVDPGESEEEPKFSITSGIRRVPV